MESREQVFKLDDWLIYPQRNLMVRGDLRRRIEPRAMDLLVRLAREPGVVFSKEQLLTEVWAGQHVVEHVLPKTVSALRKALEDDAREPRYLETIHRRGYRLLRSPEPTESLPHRPSRQRSPRTERSRPKNLLVALGTLAIPAAVGFALLLEAPRSAAERPLLRVDGSFASDGSLDDLAHRGLVHTLVSHTCIRVTQAAEADYTVETELLADDASTVRARLLSGATGEYLTAVEAEARNGLGEATERAAEDLVAAVKEHEPDLCPQGEETVNSP